MNYYRICYILLSPEFYSFSCSFSTMSFCYDSLYFNDYFEAVFYKKKFKRKLITNELIQEEQQPLKMVFHYKIVNEGKLTFYLWSCKHKMIWCKSNSLNSINIYNYPQEDFKLRVVLECNSESAFARYYSSWMSINDIFIAESQSFNLDLKSTQRIITVNFKIEVFPLNPRVEFSEYCGHMRLQAFNLNLDNILPTGLVSFEYFLCSLGNCDMSSLISLEKTKYNIWKSMDNNNLSHQFLEFEYDSNFLLLVAFQILKGHEFSHFAILPLHEVILFQKQKVELKVFNWDNLKFIQNIIQKNIAKFSKKNIESLELANFSDSLANFSKDVFLEDKFSNLSSDLMKHFCNHNIGRFTLELYSDFIPKIDNIPFVLNNFIRNPSTDFYNKLLHFYRRTIANKSKADENSKCWIGIWRACFELKDCTKIFSWIISSNIDYDYNIFYSEELITKCLLRFMDSRFVLLFNSLSISMIF